MGKKPKIAVVRGKFLNRYEMQSFEPLTGRYDITAFGSLTPFHDRFAFPVVKLPSPMDLPEFPYKMPVLNRVFTDAHFLYGLEKRLEGFDLVHSAETYYRYTRQALEAKRQGRVGKVIATVLENIPFNNEGIRGRKGFKKRAREELDHMIALTVKTKEALIAEGADEHRITVVGHGIDTRRFIPASSHWQDLADAGKKTFTIMFSGRLEVYKGIFDVLLAYHRLAGENRRVRLLVAGGGSRREDMLRIEAALGIADTVEHISVPYERMPEAYAKADCFIAPSKPVPTYDEQYCTALLEAQSMGLPIVTTNTGGIPENVRDAAVLVEPGDTGAMARALTAFIGKPALRVAYGKKARERAVTVHDIRIIADKIAGVYDRVLAT